MYVNTEENTKEMDLASQSERHRLEYHETFMNLLKHYQNGQGWPENGLRKTTGSNLIICSEVTGTVVLYMGSMIACGEAGIRPILVNALAGSML